MLRAGFTERFGNTDQVDECQRQPDRYIGTAESVCKSEIHVWGQACVRRFVAMHLRLAQNTLRIALEYIRLYCGRHMAFVTAKAQDRLARTLSRLSRIGETGPRGIEIPISNKDLASLSDIGLYTVSRLLKKLERNGAVEKKRGQVLIRCAEKMLA